MSLLSNPTKNPANANSTNEQPLLGYTLSNLAHFIKEHYAHEKKRHKKSQQGLLEFKQLHLQDILVNRWFAVHRLVTIPALFLGFTHVTN